MTTTVGQLSISNRVYVQFKQYGKEYPKLIEYGGERYLTASEIAQRLNLSWGTCSNNLLPQIQKYFLPGRKRVLYRLSDVEQVCVVRIAENVFGSAFPVSTPLTHPERREQYG